MEYLDNQLTSRLKNALNLNSEEIFMILLDYQPKA